MMPELSEFDGICSSPNPADDPIQAALHIAYAHYRGAENVHMLLGAGYDVVPVYVYGAKLFDLLTFDSSSYAQGSKSRTYKVPGSKGEIISFSSKKPPKIKKLTCDCPVCSVAKVEDFCREGSEPGILISLHNLYDYLGYVQLLSSLLEEEESFFGWIRRKCPPSTYKALTSLRDYMESNDITRFSN